MARDQRDSTEKGRSPAGGEADERRADARNLALLRVAVLIRGQTRQLCQVRNVASGGLMARVFSALVPGEKVAVEICGDRPLAGRVVWCGGGEAGIAFDRSIAVAEALAPARGRARAARLPTERLAMIRVGADIAFGSARDISPNGARLACEHPLKRGEAVTVTFEDFRPVAGVVRWRRGGLYGIGFDRRIPPAEINRWLGA